MAQSPFTVPPSSPSSPSEISESTLRANQTEHATVTTAVTILAFLPPLIPPRNSSSSSPGTLMWLMSLSPGAGEGELVGGPFGDRSDGDGATVDGGESGSGEKSGDPTGEGASAREEVSPNSGAGTGDNSGDSEANAKWISDKNKTAANSSFTIARPGNEFLEKSAKEVCEDRKKPS
ncbi:hypothetical protein SLEP1_g13773 [Rubroshorea leprosula]|uniref:Uncharacterized protein n=1 Tax=Rubroshorea leprosula TaxID=152421 RepID=A0AAV5IRG0_9ROSI|nr:hypothetical protein SLEP1_g13773 [Rubroshorea leprosula]